MPTIRRLAAEDGTRQPWKNGRGETLEIAIWPAGAQLARGDFEWRLSRAVIADDGPFSSFPDRDRTLVLIDGDGLHLDHGGAAPGRTLLPLEPYAFRGDWPTHGRLAGRACADLNVIADRRSVRAEVRVVAAAGVAELPLNGQHALLHVARGRMRAELDGVHHLDAGDTLWVIDPTRSRTLIVEEVARDAIAVLVLIAPRAG